MMIFVYQEEVKYSKSKSFTSSFYKVIKDVYRRGKNVKEVIERYEKFVKPAYEKFVQPVNATL